MLALLASSVTQAQSLNEASRQEMYSQIEALRQQLVQEQFAAPATTTLPPSASPLSMQLIQPVQSNVPQPGTERSPAELRQELARQQLEMGQVLKQESEKTRKEQKEPGNPERQELIQKLLEQTKLQQQGLTQKQQEQTKQQQQTQQQKESEKTKLIEEVFTEKKKELTQTLREKAKQEQQEPVQEQLEQAGQQESAQKQQEKTKQERQESVKEQPEQAKQQELVQKQQEKTRQQQQESLQKQSEQVKQQPNPNPGTLAAYLGAGQGDQQAQAQLAGVPDAGAAVAAGTIAVTGIAANIQALITAVVASMLASTSSSAGGNTGNLSSSVQDALQQTEQTSAVAAAQSQQSQKSQQLSYDYVTAGLVTPMASWPTSLVATYNGNVSGTLNNGAAVSGAFQATVDFSTIRNMTPSIPGSITFAGGQGSTSFTLSQLGGYIGGSMSGTYGGQAVTGYVMNGVFYGPAAEQMAGKWNMQNAAATLTGNGNFQARR